MNLHQNAIFGKNQSSEVSLLIFLVVYMVIVTYNQGVDHTGFFKILFCLDSYTFLHKNTRSGATLQVGSK